MIAITHDAIDPRPVEAAVAWSGAGAVLTFIGVTRDNFEGQEVLGLEYEAYPEMALAKMAEIQSEIIERWPGARAAMVHRLGSVSVGEISVVIAVSSPHRDAAYQASRYAIDELKQRVPVWKREIYAAGARWKANQT